MHKYRCGFKKKAIKVFKSFYDDIKADHDEYILEQYRYNEYDKFESFLSTYDGIVKIPVTIVKNKVYLASKILYGNHYIRFFIYDMYNVSQDNLMDDLDDMNKFNKTFKNKYPLVSFSRIEPLSKDVKSYINAYYSIIKYHDFIYNIFGRIGLYNDSYDLVSFVNINMTNAFWYDLYMFFGNSKDDPNLLPFTSVDVCCHELTHGLCEQLLNLKYEGESGALDESIADIFGTFVEFYINNPNDVPDWEVGEGPAGGKGIRSFKEPLIFDQPDVYKGKYWLPTHNFKDDYGGVHTNSSIINFFCYLTVNGKQNYINSNGVKIITSKYVDKFTFKDFISILFNMIVQQQIPSECSFREFGRIFIKSSKQLHYSTSVTDYIKYILGYIGIDPDGKDINICM